MGLSFCSGAAISRNWSEIKSLDGGEINVKRERIPKTAKKKEREWPREDGKEEGKKSEEKKQNWSFFLLVWLDFGFSVKAGLLFSSPPSFLDLLLLP